MDVLNKFFPFSFKFKAKETEPFIISLIIYIVACAIGGVLIGLLASLPVVGFVFAAVGGLIDLYGLIGIVLAILVYLDVIK